MVKRVSVVLTIAMLFTTTVFSFNAHANYFAGKLDGSEEARTSYNGGKGFFWAGFALTSLLSPILGGGGTLIAAYSSNPRPNVNYLRSTDYSSEYVSGFVEEYSRVAKSKNVKSAWGGVGLGTLTNILFLVALSSDDTYYGLNNSDFNTEQPHASKSIPVLRLSF